MRLLRRQRHRLRFARYTSGDIRRAKRRARRWAYMFLDDGDTLPPPDAELRALMNQRRHRQRTEQGRWAAHIGRHLPRPWWMR